MLFVFRTPGLSAATTMNAVDVVDVETVSALFRPLHLFVTFANLAKHPAIVVERPISAFAFEKGIGARKLVIGRDVAPKATGAPTSAPDNKCAFLKPAPARTLLVATTTLVGLAKCVQGACVGRKR
jgi:hypothetical protein